MTWFNDIIAALALSPLICLSLYFLVGYRGSMARLVSLFCVCLGAYVITTMSVIQANTLASYLLFRLATLAPLILWIIASLLFVDGGRISPLAWAAMAYYVIVRGIGAALALDDPQILDATLPFLFGQLLPQLILFFFSAHAIYLAQQGYATDLMEGRRRLRVAFVTCMGVLIALIVGGGLVGYFAPTLAIPTIVYSLYMFLAATAFILTSLKLDEDVLELAPNTVARSREIRLDPPSPVDTKIVQKIRRLMETETLYTEPGLTISRLAELLSLQEYRLRRVINQHLRYRNFNQFLNSYRVEEAAHRLRTSKTSISNIALDVGYSSLSVFNKAFKERFGMTPSAYRNSFQKANAPDPNPVPEFAEQVQTKI